MNTPEGHLSTVLEVKTFTLKINDDVFLRNMSPFIVKIDFEKWNATKAIDFEEPDIPGYIGLEKVCTINDIYLTDARGIMVHISGYAKFLDLLTDEQYNKICDSLSLKQEAVCL